MKFKRLTSSSCGGNHVPTSHDNPASALRQIPHSFFADAAVGTSYQHRFAFHRSFVRDLSE
jgi:hypothetical protein